MDLLRRLLFENLGLKLLALVMAVLVYLNVYTDRPATMLLTFPIQFAGLPDSLTLSGPVPAAVQAELRGTGKQLIRLRLTEPQVRISLEGVMPGRFERVIASDDLPLAGYEHLEVDRLVGPRTVELQIERRARRAFPVAVALARSGPAAAAMNIQLSPEAVFVSGPARAIAALDTVWLSSPRVDARKDSVRVELSPEALPDWCAMEPATVSALITIPRRSR